MKLKKLLLPIIVILFGLIFTIIGALFKIQHWPYGPELLTLGMSLKVIGILIIIVILILRRNKL